MCSSAFVCDVVILLTKNAQYGCGNRDNQFNDEFPVGVFHGSFLSLYSLIRWSMEWRELLVWWCPQRSSVLLVH